MKVALIIGHKVSSKGSCNEEQDVCEYDFNKELTCLVENKVYESEDTKDIDLKRVFRRSSYSKLPEEINELGFDLAISFHCNAFDSKASGTEVLYYHSSDKGKKCAEVFQKEILKALNLKDRGIKGVSTEDRGGYLLGHTKPVCVLLEPFFIDNNEDYLIAKRNKEELVKSITNSIIECKNIINTEV